MNVSTRSAWQKPYLIAWLAIPVLLVTGLLFRRHTVDVQLYDTYYVVANSHFTLAVSAFLLGIGLLYRVLTLTGKTPNAALTIMHLLPTIPVPMLLALPLLSDRSVNTEWVVVCVLTFIAGQCAFVVNILVTLLRK